jgi:alkyl sulfatase BDS1-like metallo-beta-lactamase superfamily hydrolase
VRQIFTGLRGWFDGNEAALFPLPPAERCTRLIEGFGGRDEVRRQAQVALEAGDLRWALELASWLVRSEVGADGRADGGSPGERQLLGAVLRAFAQRTTAANIRNWCLTRARELDGQLDLGRYRVHRIAAGAVRSNPPEMSVHGLRVLLRPEAAVGRHEELRWDFGDGQSVGLRLRDGVAVPTNGADADLAIALDLADWASIVGGKVDLSEALGSGRVTVTVGSSSAVSTFFACFDHPTLAR